jgi:uncharacterized FlaG/YvyC family protein
MDADVYVDRAKHVLPIINATNARLKQEADTLRVQVARQESTLREAQEAIAAMKEYQSEETARQVKEARKNLIHEIAAARESGDTELEIELTSSLGELKEVSKSVVKEAAAAKHEPQQAAAAHPDFAQWAADNSSWFGPDEDLTALAVAKAKQLRKDPANNGLMGRAFFDKAAAEARVKLYGETGRAVSKSESGGGGGGAGGGGVTKGRTVKDLPADARAVVTDPKRLSKLVGEGKAFKDRAAWEAHYVAEYFRGEEQ